MREKAGSDRLTSQSPFHARLDQQSRQYLRCLFILWTRVRQNFEDNVDRSNYEASFPQGESQELKKKHDEREAKTRGELSISASVLFPPFLSLSSLSPFSTSGLFNKKMHFSPRIPAENTRINALFFASPGSHLPGCSQLPVVSNCARKNKVSSKTEIRASSFFIKSETFDGPFPGANPTPPILVGRIISRANRDYEEKFWTGHLSKSPQWPIRGMPALNK